MSLLEEGGDVHVRRPWEEAVPRPDEVEIWQDVCQGEERKREGSWFLFVQVQSYSRDTDLLAKRRGAETP